MHLPDLRLPPVLRSQLLRLLHHSGLEAQSHRAPCISAHMFKGSSKVLCPNFRSSPRNRPAPPTASTSVSGSSVLAVAQARHLRVILDFSAPPSANPAGSSIRIHPSPPPRPPWSQPPASRTWITATASSGVSWPPHSTLAPTDYPQLSSQKGLLENQTQMVSLVCSEPSDDFPRLQGKSKSLHDPSWEPGPSPTAPLTPSAPATLLPRHFALAVPSARNVPQPDACSSLGSLLKCHLLSKTSLDPRLTSQAPSRHFPPPILCVLSPKHKHHLMCLTYLSSGEWGEGCVQCLLDQSTQCLLEPGPGT